MKSATPSKQKIITAAIAQISEVGWAKATTKSIADRSRTNELTLFRLFGSKKGLLQAALDEIMQPFIVSLQTVALVNIGDDLECVAQAYADFIAKYPGFVSKVLPEVKDPDIGEIVLPLQDRIFTLLTRIFDHYADELLPNMGSDKLILSFIGPLVARAFFGHMMNHEDFNADVYVQGFLSGYSKT